MLASGRCLPCIVAAPARVRVDPLACLVGQSCPCCLRRHRRASAIGPLWLPPGGNPPGGFSSHRAPHPAASFVGDRAPPLTLHYLSLTAHSPARRQRPWIQYILQIAGTAGMGSGSTGDPTGRPQVGVLLFGRRLFLVLYRDPRRPLAAPAALWLVILVSARSSQSST